MRKLHPVFRRRFFQGQPIKGTTVRDIIGLDPDGGEMSDEQWNQSFARCLGLYMSGQGLAELDDRGRPITDDDFLLLLNAHHGTIPFILPFQFRRVVREIVLDTSTPEGKSTPHRHPVDESYP